MLDPTERLASAETPRGELVLRRRGEVLELISNGTFLMDTSNGESERTMATLALTGRAGAARVLVAGLGFGFTLAATLAFAVADVVLVELEPAVVAWNEQWWPLGRDALRDDRVHLIIDDFGSFIQRTDRSFDVVLVDIDNGPEWTVAPPNDDVYDDLLGHLRRIVRRPDGQLCVWSSAASEEFEHRLARHFPSVTTHAVPVARGEPDVVFIATG